MRRHGVPQQILTDNGKVFTGRFGHPPTEVLFDRICRENGMEHLLTAPRSPTTTGKIERFHRSLRAECLTGQLFRSLPVAQAAVDDWVEYYNSQRPHQSLDMAVPADRFTPRDPAPDRSLAASATAMTGFPAGSRHRRRLRVLAAGLGRQTPRRRTLRRPGL